MLLIAVSCSQIRGKILAETKGCKFLLLSLREGFGVRFRQVVRGLGRVFGEGVKSARGETAIHLAAATTLETCLEHPFTQPIANKRLHSKQQK